MEDLLLNLAKSWPILALVAAALIAIVRWFGAREKLREERDAQSQRECNERVRELENRFLDTYDKHFNKATEAIASVAQATNQTATAVDRLATIILQNRDDGK